MEGLVLSVTNDYQLQNQFISVNIEETLSDYLAQLDSSEATKKTYTRCIKSFIAWLKQQERNTADYQAIMAYKNYLYAKNYSVRTVNTHITAIKSLYSYLESLGYRNSAKRVKRDRTAKTFKRQCLTQNQVKDIYSSIDTSTIEGARNNAIIRLMLGTALRICEVVRADIEDIKTNGNTQILMVKGKGEKEKGTPVILSPSVINALQEYFKMRGDIKGNEPLFTSLSDRNKGQRLTTRTVQNIVKGLYKQNGIISKDITAHSTRHTAITQAILHGATVPQAQAMARHKDINTTMIYYHDIDRLENNAESILESVYNS